MAYLKRIMYLLIHLCQNVKFRNMFKKQKNMKLMLNNSKYY